MKVKKGDTVLIISGKDKGKKGKVLRVLIDEKRIVIEGANLIKKHQKPKQSGEKGQMVEMPAPIDSSNVKLICSKCNKATRIGYKILNDNKYRVCKKCGKQI
jgi:large subunit ribosomal protein L24